MKTSYVEQFVNSYPTVEEIIKNTISSGNHEEPFYVVDIQNIIKQHKNWLLKLPRVRPYYAVKCNSCPAVLELLAALGIGFDCASKGEIDTMLKIGVRPNQIIYANPCKTRSYVKHAEAVGVDLMTFDNEQELHKVAEFHPNARMIIRIKVDDSHSVCQFSSKFGVDLVKAAHLLELAKELNLNVVGVSFHVGSGCENAASFADAIRDAKEAFSLGKKLGFKMNILDLGGGYPGTTDVPITFDEIVKAINGALDIHFPEFDELGEESEISIIAEPGRYYVASAFTLVTQIIAKRNVTDNDNSNGMMYYMNDGVYGSFNCTIFDHWSVNPVPFENQNLSSRKSYNTTLWGPTCDSMDCIKKDVMLPEMNIGEWIMFNEMGAYTIAAASTFNGFQLPAIKYHLPSHTIENLRHLPSWDRLSQIFGIDTSDDLMEVYDCRLDLMISVH